MQSNSSQSCEQQTIMCLILEMFGVRGEGEDSYPIRYQAKITH